VGGGGGQVPRKGEKPGVGGGRPMEDSLEVLFRLGQSRFLAEIGSSEGEGVEYGNLRSRGKGLCARIADDLIES